jgi:hypothetical protein
MKNRKKSLHQILYEKGQFSPIKDKRFNKMQKNITYTDKLLITDIIS